MLTTAVTAERAAESARAVGKVRVVTPARVAAAGAVLTTARGGAEARDTTTGTRRGSGTARRAAGVTGGFTATRTAEYGRNGTWRTPADGSRGWGCVVAVPRLMTGTARTVALAVAATRLAC